MKNQKLILDYGRLSDANLNLKAISVVKGLTDNPNFPTTTPTPANFALLQVAYADALNNALSGNRQYIASKNKVREDLLAAMRRLAMDIDAQGNGDKAMLLSSGFDLASTNEASPGIDVPNDFKILDGINSGELKFSCKRVINAVSYLIEYTDEPPAETTQWKFVPTSTREFTIKGLRSGLRIYGRMKAVGRKGQTANSDILSRLVQ